MQIEKSQDIIDISKSKKKIKTKIVHIMLNEKFNKPFVDFLNKNFDNKEHIILCQRLPKKDYPYSFPAGGNVIEIEDVRDLELSSNKIGKIICHSLFMRGIVEKLYSEPELLKKAYWVIWGGDLYQAPRDEQNDFVRKNFKGYLNDVDKDYAQEKYKMAGDFHKINYNFPISKEMLNSVIETNECYTKIQINNSCDPTILEMLDALSKFKDENIKITTILSYGYPGLKDEIIKKGKDIFGEKFEYIDKLMPPKDYAQHLSQNDILILNQNRQQGFGNTLASLFLGKKVFIREETSVNKYLNNKGVNIYNTQDIINMDFKTFIHYNEKEKTIKNISEYFEEKEIITQWKDIFNAE